MRLRAPTASTSCGISVGTTGACTKETVRELLYRSDTILSARLTKDSVYALLGIGMKIAAIVRCDPKEMKVLESAVAKREGTNRAWIDPQSDLFIRVCRHLFPKDRTNCYRYAEAMRQAEKQGIEPDNFSGYLRTHGGINALVKSHKNYGRKLCPHCGGEL